MGCYLGRSQIYEVNMESLISPENSLVLTMGGIGKIDSKVQLEQVSYKTKITNKDDFQLEQVLYKTKITNKDNFYMRLRVEDHKLVLRNGNIEANVVVAMDGTRNYTNVVEAVLRH